MGLGRIDLATGSDLTVMGLLGYIGWCFSNTIGLMLNRQLMVVRTLMPVAAAHDAMAVDDPPLSMNIVGARTYLTELDNILDDYNRVVREANAANTELVKRQRDAATAQLAMEVAHDIRSPIAALRAAIDQDAQQDESARNLVRAATRRVEDIANLLLTQHRKPASPAAKRSTSARKVPFLPSIVVDELILRETSQRA